MSATYGFDNFGYPVSSVTGTIQNYSYNFNPVTGNLTWRQNNKYTGLKEDFNYDNLDRLDDVKKGGIMTLDMAYEGNKGGITTKSDVGTLVYNTSGKPYAVSSINPTTGLTPGAAQAITYTSFQKVSTISENNYNATFTYNADDSRAKMVVKQNTTTILTRWYPTNSYIKETAGSTTREYTFIGGDAYSAPVVAIKQGSTTTWYYILRDYLGSITHLVKSTTVTSAYAEYSYDAWGRMRNPSTWAIYAPGSEPALFLAGRGYTGHEHLPWFNLINMNGRVYDPLVGMFLSPDNYIQNPGFTQNFNRYGYCLNNPLKYSDPSGMLMAPADFGREIDAYQNWMCDVAGAYHYSGGGGGGGGYHYDWKNEVYRNDKGEVTTWNEVYFNYVVPFSYSVNNPEQFVKDFQKQYSFAQLGITEDEYRNGLIASTDGDPHSNVKKADGKVSSVSIGFAFVGGFGIELGRVSDNFGNKKWFFSYDANIGYGFGIGINSKDIYAEPGCTFNVLTNYPGYSAGIQGGILIFGGERSGDINENVSFTRYWGDNYRQQAGSVSWSPVNLGFWWFRSKTKVWP